MTIYRIENDKGGGPYAGSNYYKFPREYRELLYIMLDEHNDKHHLIPVEDGIENFEHGVDFCGFQTLACLKDWFKGWWDYLIIMGFKIIQIEIDPKYVKIGDSQVCFDYSKIISKEVVSYGH